MDKITIMKLLLISLSLLPNQCALQDLHSPVPSTCPPNRTKINQQPGTSNTAIGQVNVRFLNDFVRLFAEGRREELNEFFIHTGGIYLLPEAVPFDAYIVEFMGFGFVDLTITIATDLPPFVPPPRETDATDDGLVAPFYYVVVYRPIDGGQNYSLVYDLTQFAHGFAPGRLPADRSRTLDWPVQQGDLIGAYIPYGCVNRSSDHFLMCPSQINIITNNCLSAFYHPALNGVDNILISDFTEVLTELNMQVVLSPRDGPAENVIAATVAPVITIVVAACVVIAVVIVIVWCTVHSKRSASAGQKTLQTPMLEQQVSAEDQANQQQWAARCPTYDVPPENTDRYTLITKDSLPESLLSENNRLSNNYLSASDPDGYEYDYQEAYFEPASKEEELVVQLNKLTVTEIPRDKLELCEVLGTGAFGTVYRGVWSHSMCDGGSEYEEVAVKTVDTELSEAERIKFLQEATIMAQFKHSNIIALKGVLLKDQMMIVIDLMEGGDLRKYLLTTMRERSSKLDAFELASTLLSYTRQVAHGMVYLQFKSYIHRDLAARNILMSRDRSVCKIADFGLSRDLQHENFYVSHGGKIPVKWTAPEALQYRKYSTASDVWSYGCVLYEIWSLGHKPFQDMTNHEVMNHVTKGNRLSPPPGCPRAIYTIMIDCWHPDAEQRPCFDEIIQQLQKPDFLVLKWSADDVNSYSQVARTLGSPIQIGTALYKDLQTSYLTTDNQ